MNRHCLLFRAHIFFGGRERTCRLSSSEGSWPVDCWNLPDGKFSVASTSFAGLRLFIGVSFLPLLFMVFDSLAQILFVLHRPNFVSVQFICMFSSTFPLSCPANDIAQTQLSGLVPNSKTGEAFCRYLVTYLNFREGKQASTNNTTKRGAAVSLLHCIRGEKTSSSVAALGFKTDRSWAGSSS